MKIKSLLASSLVVSIASVSMAYAQESNEVVEGGRRVIYIFDCDGQALDRDHRTYKLAQDVECDRPHHDFQIDEAALADIPEEERERLRLIRAGFPIVGKDITFDLNGYEIEFVDDSSVDSRRKFNTGVLVISTADDRSDGNNVINTSDSSEAEIDGFNFGVIVLGDKNELADFEVDGPGVEATASFDLPNVGVWVLGDDNDVHDLISENNSGAGYLLGFPVLENDSFEIVISLPFEGNSFSFNGADENGDGFVCTTHIERFNPESLNVFYHNAVVGGDHGIYLDHCSGNLVLDNQVIDTTEEAFEIEGNNGFAKGDDGVSNLVIDNTAFDNDGEGFDFEDSQGNIVIGNFAVENEGLDFEDSNGECARDIFDIADTNFYFANHAQVSNTDPSCTVKRQRKHIAEVEALVAKYTAAIK